MPIVVEAVGGRDRRALGSLLVVNEARAALTELQKDLDRIIKLWPSSKRTYGVDEAADVLKAAADADRTFQDRADVIFEDITTPAAVKEIVATLAANTAKRLLALTKRAAGPIREAKRKGQLRVSLPELRSDAFVFWREVTRNFETLLDLENYKPWWLGSAFVRGILNAAQFTRNLMAVSRHRDVLYRALERIRAEESMLAALAGEIKVQVDRQGATCAELVRFNTESMRLHRFAQDIAGAMRRAGVEGVPPVPAPILFGHELRVEADVVQGAILRCSGDTPVWSGLQVFGLAESSDSGLGAAPLVIPVWGKVIIGLIISGAVAFGLTQLVRLAQTLTGSDLGAIEERMKELEAERDLQRARLLNDCADKLIAAGKDAGEAYDHCRNVAKETFPPRGTSASRGTNILAWGIAGAAVIIVLPKVFGSKKA